MYIIILHNDISLTKFNIRYYSESIYEQFVERMVAESKKRVVGDPFDANTTHGPQVSFYLFFFAY